MGRTLHEFQTTAGRQQPCNACSAAGVAHVQQPTSITTLFEAMAPDRSPNCSSATTAHGMAAGDVGGGLAASAALWDSLVRTAAPGGMQPHKLLATDLLGRAELPLVEALRPLMIQHQFAPSEHVSQAVERFRYEEMPAPRRAALGACLTDLCAAVGITLDELFEFETLTQWARERNSCFHPPAGHNARQLDSRDAVAAARTTVTTSPEFQGVRASLLLLVSILESRLPAAPPAPTAPYGRSPCCA